MAETKGFPCEQCGCVEGINGVTPTYVYYVRRDEKRYVRLCRQCLRTFKVRCWNCGTEKPLSAPLCCLHNVSEAEVGRIQSRVRASEPQWSPIQRQMIRGRIGSRG